MKSHTSVNSHYYLDPTLFSHSFLYLAEIVISPATLLSTGSCMEMINEILDLGGKMYSL